MIGAFGYAVASRRVLPNIGITVIPSNISTITSSITIGNSFLGTAAITTPASNLRFYTRNILAGTFDLSGNLTVTGDITASSDRRVKENIISIDGALEKINSLRGVYYNRISTTTRKMGLIAQEVESIIPEVVLTDDTPEHMKAVSYGNITALLIEGVNELTGKYNSLQSTVAGLTSQMLNTVNSSN